MHYASPGRDCLKDDDHAGKCVPGPWYGSRPSFDPDWSHQHHPSRVVSCAQCGKPFEVTCHQSRRKYCGGMCAKAARRNRDRARLRERYRWQAPIKAHNNRIEAAYQERFQRDLSRPVDSWSAETEEDFQLWLDWGEADSDELCILRRQATYLVVVKALARRLEPLLPVLVTRPPQSTDQGEYALALP
jgi:hypothetical protein